MNALDKTLLSRRQFGSRVAALGLTLPTLGSLLFEQSVNAADTATKSTTRTVKLPDGTIVSALGQGCMRLGQDRRPAAVEEEALRDGISLGMTLVDTSGNYGKGRAEQFLNHVIAGQRDKIYLVSKVEANQISGDGITNACDASLARLGTSYLDLYLMHWPVPSDQLAHMVAQFEQLRSAKKIRAWGVSNFGVELLEDLFRVPQGNRCATNQVPYSLVNRGIERDTLPWCKQHNMPIMAYSPLGGGNSPLIGDHTLTQIGAAHGCSAAAIALAWDMRNGNVIPIPESGAPEHTKDNAVALTITLTPQELQTLDTAFPAPGA